jgi:hypothetical protein
VHLAVAVVPVEAEVDEGGPGVAARHRGGHRAGLPRVHGDRHVTPQGQRRLHQPVPVRLRVDDVADQRVPAGRQFGGGHAVADGQVLAHLRVQAQHLGLGVGGGLPVAADVPHGQGVCPGRRTGHGCRRHVQAQCLTRPAGQRRRQPRPGRRGRGLGHCPGGAPGQADRQVRSAGVVVPGAGHRGDVEQVPVQAAGGDQPPGVLGQHAHGPVHPVGGEPEALPARRRVDPDLAGVRGHAHPVAGDQRDVPVARGHRGVPGLTRWTGQRRQEPRRADQAGDGNSGECEGTTRSHVLTSCSP